MNASPSSIVIRDITDISEMRAVEQLQRDVWGVEDVDVFPALALRPQKDLGAVLMGAFSGEKMVGFVFGFPGILAGETIIHSDMLAVSPEFRSFGLGYSLKLAQRDKAIEMGIEKITWTYDPLQLRNANLNFGKLGVVADRYDVNYYGQTSSFLHNFGTDRLWVTWHLNSDRVKDRVTRGSAPNILLDASFVAVSVDDDNEPVSSDGVWGNPIAIQIPADINKVKAEGNGKAERWREATRVAFTKALEKGYVVQEFVVSETTHGKVGSYLLSP